MILTLVHVLKDKFKMNDLEYLLRNELSKF